MNELGISMKELWLALPEIFILAAACFVLLIDLFVARKEQYLTYICTQIALIIAFFITASQYRLPDAIIFHGTYVFDNLSVTLKCFVYILTFVNFMFARDFVAKRGLPQGEYYVLSLLAMLGMMVMISGHSILTLYLGLELLSLPLYVLVAISRDEAKCAEGAMKYFATGALASGLFLYGLSIIYGMGRTLDIAQLAQVSSHFTPAQGTVLIFGLVFVLAGILFKFGAAPFHMWVPDAYDGAPSSVTVFLGSAPKLAVFAILVRLLFNGMPELHHYWEQVLMVVAIFSMATGNFIAIAQTNIKRLLAYSSVAHIGYMSLGLIVGTKAGHTAALFYMMIYTLMSVGAFGMVVLMSRVGFDAERIEDYKGLNTRNPWLAFMMMCLMFSMAGIPPTIGFFAKLSVLEALVDNGYLWLAVMALMFAVVGAYYYLRIIKTMYFDAPDEPTTVTIARDMRLAISVNGLAVIVLGLMPGAIISLCRAAMG